MEPSTRDILVEFMNTQLAKRGHRSLHKLPVARNGHRQNQSSNFKSREYRSMKKSLNDICRSLDEMSSELHEFIKNAYNDKFRQSIDIIDIENPDYEGLNRLADTLFSPDISWFHILTFLHYGAELACKGFEWRTYNNEEGGYEMVCKIIDWMCKYIDTKLLNWIEEQGGWISVLGYKEHECKSMRPKYNAFLGFAAFAVVTGGLYLCSKFNGQ